MILPRKFILSEDNQYEHLAVVSGRLRAVLEAFSENRLPPEYRPEVLAGYTCSLIAVQRSNGSFSSSRNPESLDPDVKTDALRFVTWAATAFLSLFKMRFSDEAASMEGLGAALEEALAAALDCSEISDFSFPESGEAQPVQQVEAALILASGCIPQRLKSHPAHGGALAAALRNLSADFQSRLDSGNTKLPGGIDYRPLFEQVIASLQLVRKTEDESGECELSG